MALGEHVTAVPLRRNRDFMLLQTGQLLSNAGTQSTSIAYPLLVLAVTGSAAKAGVVAFARTLPAAVFALPAGLAADRWNRKWLMLAADGVRVLAIGGLAAAILLHAVPYWAIVLVAFIEGVGATFFSVAYTGALRAVVPTRQLPAAAGAQTRPAGGGAARRAAARGALFGVARALPFLVDAASYAFSTLSLLAMRTPFQEEREPDLARLRSRLAEGFRFLWRQPFLRTSALLFGLANFIGPGLLLAVVVIGTRQGLSGGEVGALVAAVRRPSPGGLLSLAARAPPPSGSSRPGAGALDLARLRAFPHLAERLCPRSRHSPDGAGDPVDRLRRPRLPDCDDTRPAARPRRVGAEHDLASDRAARPARGRRPARNGFRLDGGIDWNELAGIAEDAYAEVAPAKLVEEARTAS